MNKIVGFLEEAPGQQSFTRIACAFIIGYAIVGTGAILVTGLMVYYHHPDIQTLGAVAAASGAHMGGISGVAATWKTWQKGKEGQPDAAVDANNPSLTPGA